MGAGSRPGALRRALAAALLLAAAAACGRLGHDKIKAILDNPRDYDGRTVSVEGEVVDAVNLLVVRYYVVRDDTGQIPVVASRAVPRKGARVSARGTVHQAFAIGDATLTVIVEPAE